MTIRVREATPDDAATILRFVRELAEYEREPDAVKVDEATLRAQMASSRPPFECLLAYEGEPVGFALFFPTYSTWLGKAGLWLEDLYVTPAARGAGAGLAMLAHLEAICRERDYGRLELAALNWNEPALRFYRARGFTPMDKWTTWRLPIQSQ